MFKQHLHQVLLKSSGAQARSEKHSPIAMCPTVTPTGSWLRSRDQNGEPRPRVGQKVYYMGKASSAMKENLV